MRISNILSRYSELKEASIPTLTNQHSYKVSQFHKMLKSTYGKSLAKLQVCEDQDLMIVNQNLQNFMIYSGNVRQTSD